MAGKGLLEARLWRSLPVARAAGPETDKGELMRYLAELAWVPDAILFNRELIWSTIDERTVEVPAVYPEGLAPVRLRFDEQGDLAGSEGDDRPYRENDRIVARRWIGRFWDFRDLNGYRIPARGKVRWRLDDGDFTYWRGELLDVVRTKD